MKAATVAPQLAGAAPNARPGSLNGYGSVAFAAFSCPDEQRDAFKNAPGFDKSNWPGMADVSCGHAVREYWTDSGDYGLGRQSLR